MRSSLAAPEATVLTACLSCGWVHEFPGTCPRSSETWRELAREFTAEPPPVASPATVSAASSPSPA